MNYITIQKLHELQRVIDADIYLSGSPYGQREEIYNNTWYISFDKDIALKLKKSSLEQFFYQLIEKRLQQIDLISKNMPVTFYMWVDEISMQLCFDFISGQCPILPFRCKLNLVQDKNIIFDHFLASVSKGGIISYDEITFYEKSDFHWDDDEDHLKNFVLDVYICVLNNLENEYVNIYSVIDEQTIIDRQFAFELMQIFLDNYCQKNYNQDLINLVQNSRIKHSHNNFSIMPHIIEQRIWQIWQQVIFKVMQQEQCKVLNLLIAFYAMLYFLVDYFYELEDSFDDNQIIILKKMAVKFALDQDNKPIDFDFWRDWISGAEQLNTKNIELLHHIISINTTISENIILKIIKAWFEYQESLIHADLAQQILVNSQRFYKAINLIKQQPRSYLLLDDEITILEAYYIMLKLLELHDLNMPEFIIDPEQDNKSKNPLVLLEWIRICEQVMKA